MMENTAGKDGAAGTSSGRSSTTSQMTPLAGDFEPSADDVICGRGKKCYNHIGNERFRQRVLTFLDEYSRAKTKMDKSAVLSKVVEEVRQHSPTGGFVKQDASGMWHEVGDFLAREKTSQAFRDALHDRYKSSNISKKKRRQEEQAKASSNYNKIVRSEYEISSRLERLSNEVLGSHGLQDLDSLDRFNRNNYEMLSRLNREHAPSSGRGRSRRYSSAEPSSPREYRPGQDISGSHFPDPLFGSSINAANAMPSDFAHEKLSPQQRDGSAAARERKYSLSSAPAERTGGHHDPFDEDVRLHQSMPDLAYSKHGYDSQQQQEQDKKPPARDAVEPIPLQHINIPGHKTVAGPPVKKPAPAAGAATAAGPSLEDVQMSSSSSGRSTSGGSGGGGRRISKDLMECLDKMTYHSIADDNPYEPIPLTPQQEKAHRRKMLQARAGASELFDRNPLDDSERDEFAEG